MIAVYHCYESSMDRTVCGIKRPPARLSRDGALLKVRKCKRCSVGEGGIVNHGIVHKAGWFGETAVPLCLIRGDRIKVSNIKKYKTSPKWRGVTCKNCLRMMRQLK